ncbi:MAG: SRPBCC domain-containing protein [Myxococcaceae bacterium]|nr:SRPBCC domain-containing protein [Myxococcaceae bacterium]
MSENIEVSRIIAARPNRIFEAWLSGDEHGKMIGSSATVDADGSFSAWDGYISGSTLVREPYRRILQAWRTTEFPPGAPDSQLEVLLEDVSGGTKVTLKHTLIPDGQGRSYAQGWNEHYFDPMLRYFEAPSSKLNDMNDALSEAMGHTSEAFEAAGAQAKKTLKKVQKSAKKAAVKVKAFVGKAKKQLAKRKAALTKKVKAKPKKAAAKKKKPARKSRR